MRSTLWLVPRSPEREALGRIITDLARETGGPAFEPHVTLLSGMSVLPDEILRRVGPLARDLPQLHLGPVEVGETRHRCVFYSIKPTDELCVLHAEAASRLGASAGTFSPHLSVVYGVASADVRRTIAADPRLASWTQSVLATGGLEVWSTQGPEQGWRKLAP